MKSIINEIFGEKNSKNILNFEFLDKTGGQNMVIFFNYPHLWFVLNSMYVLDYYLYSCQNICIYSIQNMKSVRVHKCESVKVWECESVRV